MNNNSSPRFAAKPPRTSMPDWYPDLLDSVASHISTGHRRAITAANTEMLTTYWSIGQEILTRQNQEGWGAKVIDRLSADLKGRFPTAKGYSPRNLKYMRAFAAGWPDRAIVQAPLAQLPWYHHLALLQKLESAEMRLWYAQAAIEHGWSRDVLALQIDTGFHRRSGKAVTNFAATITDEQSDLAQQATRDPYMFDFVGTAEKLRERELEQGLIDHIGKFLIELGQGFAFVGRQVRLELAGEEFYCDLLFYHLELRCFIRTTRSPRPTYLPIDGKLAPTSPRTTARCSKRLFRNDGQALRRRVQPTSTSPRSRWTHGRSETVVQWSHHDQPGRLTARADFLSPED